MAAEREPTPEKQLLNLIEKPKAGNIQQAQIKRGGLSLFSLGAFRGRFSFFKKKTSSALTNKREPLDIKGINRLLRLGVFVLGAYFASSFSLAVLDREKDPTMTLDTAASESSAIIKASSPLKKLSF